MLLFSERIHFDHSAVDLERQFVAMFLPVHRKLHDARNILDDSCFVRDWEPEFSQDVETGRMLVEVRKALRRFVIESQLIGTKSERPFGDFPRVERFKRAGGRVSRICERRLTLCFTLYIHAPKSFQFHKDFASNFKALLCQAGTRTEHERDGADSADVGRYIVS